MLLSVILPTRRIFSRIMGDIKRLMDSKRLKLNDFKTECISIGTRFILKGLVEQNYMDYKLMTAS